MPLNEPLPEIAVPSRPGASRRPHGPRSVDHAGSPRQQLTRGLMLRHQRQHAAAIEPLLQAADSARKASDQPLWVRCELALGSVLAELAEFDGAGEHLREALRGATALADRALQREAHQALAQMLLDADQTLEAEQAWLALTQDQEPPAAARAHAWHQLGRCRMQAGRHAQALAPLHEALGLWAEQAGAEIPSALWRDLGLGLAHTGSDHAARTALQNALQLARRRQDAVEQARCLHALGLAAELSDQLDTAGSLAEHSLRLARQLKALPEQHAACSLLLHVHRRRRHLVACLACSDELRAVEQQWHRATLKRRMEALYARLALHQARQQEELETLRQQELQRVQKRLAQTHRALRLAMTALAQTPGSRRPGTAPACGAAPAAAPNGSPFTPREQEVLRLMAQGLSNPGIAAELGLSPVTVRHHVSAILGKLGVASRTEAVAQAVRRGWM